MAEDPNKPKEVKPFTDIVAQPPQPADGTTSIRELKDARAGRGARSFGFDQSGMFFGGDTMATAVLKMLMTGKLIIQIHDYAGGTTGGPESDADVEDGMVYIGENYGGAGTHKFFARIGGAWKSVTLA